jgi:hypothetical protein
VITLWQAWFLFLVLRKNDFPFRFFWKCRYIFLIFRNICTWCMIITLDKTVVHNWKLAAAFVLFSLSSWNVHRLFSDAWWSGAVKYRWSPGAAVFWMYCRRYCYLHVPIVLKSGRLLETTGSVKVCNGIALPFTVVDDSNIETLISN